MSNDGIIFAFLAGQFQRLFGFLFALFALCAVYNLVLGLVLHKPKELDSPSSQEGKRHLRRVRKHMIWAVVMFAVFNFIPSRRDILVFNILDLSNERRYDYRDYEIKLRNVIYKMEKDRHADSYDSSKREPPSDRELVLQKELDEAGWRRRLARARFIKFVLDEKIDSVTTPNNDK